MPVPLSTLSRLAASRRAVLLSGLALAACVAQDAPPGPRTADSRVETDVFVMSDGARLPYRAWLPDGMLRSGERDDVHAVVLALHGFNDSRDSWELAAPMFADAGIAFYGPDQRGFGGAPGRGLWPGADALADDAAEMAGVLRARHPGTRLVLMGESMGGAVLMHLAANRAAPPGASYVLLAPAVWGRARMNILLRSGLFIISRVAPGLQVTRAPAGVRVIPTDNNEALRRMSRNPLTILGTRFDTLRGLVDLMDLALDAAPRLSAPSLFLYGAKDDLVPPEATTATWRNLSGPVRRAFYPRGYHLLFRDLARAVPITDTINWILRPGAPLPSAAEQAAEAWLTARA